MTERRLYYALKELAGNDPALVLSRDALHGLLLNNFRDATKHLRGESLPIEGFPEIEARFVGLQEQRFSLSLFKTNEHVVAAMSTPFSITIGLHVTSDPTLEFSEIHLEVQQPHFRLNANAPNLLISEPDFEVATNIIHSNSRSTAIEAVDASEDDVIGIERAIASFMPRRIVTSVLSTLPSIDLAQRCTAFEMRGDWTLDVIEDNLVVRPSDGIILRSEVGCPTRDSAPKLSAKFGNLQDTGDSDFSWDVTPDGVPVSVTKQPHGSDAGFAALYVPREIWEGRFSKTMPAVVRRVTSDGFIGYDMTLTVAMEYSRLSIVPNRFGLLIELKFVPIGNAFLTVKVPCVGRMDLAYVRFSGDRSDLDILLSFVPQPHGKLALESQIDRLDMGRVTVSVSAFSKYLAMAGGKAAVIGFVTDHLLKRVAERLLPTMIEDAIRRELNSKNFELLDLEDLTMFTSYGFNAATFSGDEDSVLVGLGSFG